MSQARISYITEAVDSRVLALPKPRRISLGLPFSVWTTMILLALIGLCLTAGWRTQAQLQRAAEDNRKLVAQVRDARSENARLSAEVAALGADARTIETAARRMGMVKKDEMVVVIPQNK